jgi:ABC-2 type transport system permease protein
VTGKSRRESVNLPGDSPVSIPAVLAGRRFGLWHYVWKLLRLRWVITWSGLKRSRTRRKIGLGIIAVLVLGFAGILFWGSWALLGFLRSPYVMQFTDPAALLESMPTVVFSFAFIAVLLTNFGVLLQALYLAKDMDFLLVAPLPMRAVFFTKLLQAILPNFGLVCLFGLPVLFGLGVSSHYQVLYYPLVVISLGMLTLAAGGISGLLVMAIVRVIPARRVAEVLGFIGVVLSVLISQSSRLFTNVNLSNSQLSTGLNTLVKVNTPFSPLAWTGRGLVDIGNGHWLGGLGLLSLALILAGAIFWIALTSAERLYYSGWASLQVSPHRMKRQNRWRETRMGGVASAQAVATPSANAGKDHLFPRFISPSLRAMVWKDFTLLRRDLRNLSQLITPLLLGVIVVVSTARSGLGGNRQSDFFASNGIDFSFYGSLAFALFIGWSLMLTLTIGAFSREGRNYWLIKTSPINTRTLLLSKFLVSFIPSLLFEWVLLLTIQIAQGGRVGLLLYGLIITLFYVAGSIGINLAFGVIGARLDWQDPRQMNSTSLGCLGTAASFVYFPISLMFFFLPVLGFTLLSSNQTLGQIVGAALGAVFCLTCAVVPPLLVRRKVARIGQK